jgi:malate dehydrogenase (oxaloacetate-decarboxylating)(NADP+)
MATVSVVDAQLKTRIDTEAEVQRTSWWKRMRKRKQ